MRNPPGSPNAYRSLPSRSTITGAIDDVTRLPGATAFARSECGSNTNMRLFGIMPVPGTMQRAPNNESMVCVLATTLPMSSANVRCVVWAPSPGATPALMSVRVSVRASSTCGRDVRRRGPSTAASPPAPGRRRDRRWPRRGRRGQFFGEALEPRGPSASAHRIAWRGDRGRTDRILAADRVHAAGRRVRIGRDGGWPRGERRGTLAVDDVVPAIGGRRCAMPPPSMPTIIGSTTVRLNNAAMAASIALPPAASISAPAAEASGGS